MGDGGRRRHKKSMRRRKTRGREDMVQKRGKKDRRFAWQKSRGLEKSGHQSRSQVTSLLQARLQWCSNPKLWISSRPMKILEMKEEEFPPRESNLDSE